MKRKFVKLFTRSFSDLMDFLLNEEMKITVQSTPNIATLKYWGKRDEHHIIPLNDNISVLLDEPTTKTTIIASQELDESLLFLNKEKVSLSDRLNRCIQLSLDNSNNEIDESYNFCIISENNFPTASGLASSASGYSSISFGLCQLMDIEDKTKQSCIARVGSGSACRSIHGGFSKWITDDSIENMDYSSFAKQLHDNKHWKTLQILLCIVDSEEKKISSTKGQVLSVENSKLLKDRVEIFVPSIMEKMEDCIAKKDKETFFELMMQDCENFHSVCVDTTPPLKYRNETSFQIVEVVSLFNKINGRTLAGYTFDAGANAVLLCEKRNVDELKYMLSFLMDPKTDNVNKYLVELTEAKKIGFDFDYFQKLSVEMGKLLQQEGFERGGLKEIFHTKLGKGPKVLEFDEDCLNFVNE